MRMNGMYREDEVTRVDLLGYVNICKFIEEADVVLELCRCWYWSRKRNGNHKNKIGCISSDLKRGRL